MTLLHRPAWPQTGFPRFPETSHVPGFARTEDPADRLARLKAEFAAEPCEERKERMVGALRHYLMGLGARLIVLEEVAAMDAWADLAIEAAERGRRP